MSLFFICFGVHIHKIYNDIHICMEPWYVLYASPALKINTSKNSITIFIAYYYYSTTQCGDIHLCEVCINEESGSFSGSIRTGRGLFQIS